MSKPKSRRDGTIVVRLRGQLLLYSKCHSFSAYSLPTHRNVARTVPRVETGVPLLRVSMQPLTVRLSKWWSSIRYAYKPFRVTVPLIRVKFRYLWGMWAMTL